MGSRYLGLFQDLLTKQVRNRLIVNFSRSVCDRRFAERNAEVVCKQLGYDMLNVYLDFDQRIEYDALSLTRIIYWVCSAILNFCIFDDAILISIFSA